MSALTLSIGESVIVPHIPVRNVGTVREQVHHGFKVTFAGRYAECCAPVVVVSIHAPADDVKGLHEQKVVFVSRVQQAELIICDGAVWHVKHRVIIATLCAFFLEEFDNLLVLSIVEGRGAPSVVGVDVDAVFH